MSINTGSTLSWNDIKTLYTNLNTALEDFSIEVQTPEKPNLASTSAISNLQNAINASINGNSYLRNQVSKNIVSIPNKNDLIKTLEFLSLNDTIEDIEEACPYNSSYNGSCHDHVSYGNCITKTSNSNCLSITTYDGCLDYGSHSAY